MKKNLLSVIILTLCAINVILTILIVFVVLPTSNKTNKLITQVATVLDLELKTPLEEKEEERVDIDNLEVKTINQQLTINLKNTEGEAAIHFAMIDSVSLSLNSKSKDYDSLVKKFDTYTDIVTDLVTSVFNKYTIEECIDNKEDIRKEILKDIQEEFDSDAIVNVSFGNLRAQ